MRGVGFGERLDFFVKSLFYIPKYHIRNWLNKIDNYGMHHPDTVPLIRKLNALGWMYTIRYYFLDAFFPNRCMSYLNRELNRLTAQSQKKAESAHNENI